VALVPPPRRGWKRRSGCPPRHPPEPADIDDPLRPQSAYGAGEICDGTDEPAAGPVDRRADRCPVDVLGVVVRHLRRPRGLVALEPGEVHPEWVEHVLAVHLVERLTGDLLDENAADHISGVRIVKAPARSKRPGSMLGR